MPDQVAFSRGSTAFIVLNRDTGGTLSGSALQTGMAAGKYCDIIQCVMLGLYGVVLR